MGELLGTQMQPRDIAATLHEAGFTDAENLLDATMICLSESQGYDRAYNDNLDSAGNVSSRDVGLMQINIPASAIGTQTEEDLYVPANNAKAAHDLFKNRGFQPWVAYNTNVYLRDTYLKRATRGMANFLADERLQRPTDTLNNGTPYAHTLTTPVVDYEYRVSEQHVGLMNIRTLADEVIRATTLAQAVTLAKQLRSVVASVINVPKE